MISKKLSLRISSMSFICACLVVFVHVPQNRAVAGLYSWLLFMLPQNLCEIAVPYFFIVSGFLVAHKYVECGEFKTLLVKRVRTLLVPYILLNLVWLLYGVAVNRLLSHEAHNLSSINTYIEAIGLNLNLCPQIMVLWYVRALLIMLPFVPLCVNFLSARHSALVMISLFLVYGIVECHLDLLPCSRGYWLFGISLKGIAYFLLGIYLRTSKIQIDGKTTQTPWSGALALVTGLLVMQISSLRFIGILLSVVGSWILTNRIQIPQVLCRNAFCLYVLHDLLFAHVKGLVASGRFQWTYSVWGYFFWWALSIVLSIFVSEVMRRLSPRAHSLVFGGR